MIVPMTLLRRYTALLLAAALLLTGHSAAASRFARDATGQVILCTGTGPVTVYVDENGEPTRAQSDVATERTARARAPPLV